MKNKIWTIVSVIVLLLQVAVEALAATAIFRLNMLPDRYTLIFVAVLTVPVFINGLMLFVRGKKQISTVRRIIACILALLVICGSCMLTKIVSDANRAMNAVTQGGEVTEERGMHVLVRADDPANVIADAAEYAFAVVQDYEVELTQQTTQMIEQQTGKPVNLTQFETVPDLVDALLTKEVDALILNDASVAFLMEDETYADFEEKTKILYTVYLEQIQGAELVEPETEPEDTDDGDITKKPFVVYISGIDTRSSKLRVSRSDVNILAVVNPTTKQVLLVNTPRDYYVPNPAGNGKLDKLTHCGLYGVSCSMEALEDLYGIEIQHYARINFNGFETLIDAVGGITVYSDQAFKAHTTYIQKGENHLNGADALNFARERYHVSGGDNGRGKNQMKVITALIDKMTSGTTIISNYSSILKSLEGMFTTSVTSEEISAFVKMQIDDMSRWDVQSFAVTGKGGSEKTYSAPGMNAYVMHPNKESVAYATSLIERVFAGNKLTAEDMKIPD